MTSLIFKCGRCGKTKVVDNPIRTNFLCDCGGAMRVQDISVDEQPKPKIGLPSASRLPPTSLMSLALEPTVVDVGSRRGIYTSLGEKEDILWIVDGLKKIALETPDGVLPHKYALLLALRIKVDEKTAMKYADKIVYGGYFQDDFQNFIVDLEKAKKELGVLS